MKIQSDFSSTGSRNTREKYPIFLGILNFENEKYAYWLNWLNQTTNEQTYNTMTIINDTSHFCSHVAIEPINLVLEENMNLSKADDGWAVNWKVFCRRSQKIWGFVCGKIVFSSIFAVILLVTVSYLSIVSYDICYYGSVTSHHAVCKLLLC